MDWDGYDTFNMWEADASYNAPTVADTAVTDILQETQSSPTGSDQWTGFFQDVIKGAVGYATAKDAAETKASLAQNSRQAQFRTTAMQQQQTSQNLLPLLLIGGLILILND